MNNFANVMTYNSKKQISRAGTFLLRQELEFFCKKYTHWYCRALKKRISFEKLPNAIINRKASRGNRLRCFWVALDILKQERVFVNRIVEGKNKRERDVEICGYAADGEKVFIHLRQELNMHKDTRWFFVSSFYKEK